MTIEQLNELDLVAVEEEFGYCLPEEIACCNDLQALTDLAALISVRVLELTNEPANAA